MGVILTKPKSSIFKFINHLAFIILLFGVSFYSYVLLFPVSATIETYKILHNFPTVRHLSYPLHHQSQTDVDTRYAHILLSTKYLNNDSPHQALAILKPLTTSTALSKNTLLSLQALFVYQSNPNYPPSFISPNPIFSPKNAFQYLEILKKDYPNVVHRVVKYIKSEKDLLSCGKHISFAIDYPKLKECVSGISNPTT